MTEEQATGRADVSCLECGATARNVDLHRTVNNAVIDVPRRSGAFVAGRELDAGDDGRDLVHVVCGACLGRKRKRKASDDGYAPLESVPSAEEAIAAAESADDE